MANEALVKILRQGVEVWNQWREAHPEIEDIDFSEIKPGIGWLLGVNLSGANLSGVNFQGTILGAADLTRANLTGADLTRANLMWANLSDANLSKANLSWADIRGANLYKAKLSETNFNGALLNPTNLDGRDVDVAVRGMILLYLAKSTMNEIGATNLSECSCSHTIFANVDLSTVKGLATINHLGPSSISVDTLYNSQGKIPEVFLRGCGLPDNLITYLPSLVGQAINFYSCFISYSHANKDFARRLHDRLQGEGIRCWLDEHQLNIGDPLHPTIYEAIRVYDKVLLCCSETALTSWWVEKEFSRAIRKEEDYKANVLVPLNLDGYLFAPTCEGWVADELKQRLVADFTGWKDHDAFERGVKAVMKALRTDGGKEPPPEPKLKRKG